MGLQDVRNEQWADLVRASIHLIKQEQHSSGSYPACPTYPTYRYCWFRDGSFIADAMSRADELGSADAFFGWCGRVLLDRADAVGEIAGRASRAEEIDPGTLMPTRFNLDGSASHAPWSNFQVDGYGTWLRALVDHATRHRLHLRPYADAINLTVDYLGATWELPCYDWWEEFPEQRHTSTLAAVHSGLTAALESGTLTADREPLAQRAIAGIGSLLADDATQAGHLTKWLGSPAVDGSLLACLLPYRVVPLDGPVATGTVREIRDQLLNDGVYRYVGDTFYGGGEWVNLTAWLGWYEAATGDTASARSRLEWIVSQARDGLLPEQITAHAQHPDYIERWENMWGPVATPLLWSHAMFLVLASAVAS